MRNAFWLIGAALMSIGLIAGPASAEWLEAKNARFVIYGNVSAKEMARFADRLARFDAVMHRLIPGPEGTSGQLTIYMVDSTGDVRRLSNGGPSRIAGYYSASASGAYAVTPRTTDTPEFTQQVLFHEYVHHVTLGANQGYYPSWAAEGLAELFGTAVIMADGGVRVGMPNNARAYSILSNLPMPVSTLLADRPVKDPEAVDQKYGRAWLLVHYLMLGGAPRGSFEQYIKLINDGVPQAEAATKAFGDVDKLDAALNRYRNGKLRTPIFAAADLQIDQPVIRQLDAGEAAMMPLRVRSATGVDAREASELVGPARRTAAEFPKHPWVQRVLAEIEFDAGNDAEAEAACDAALAIKPTDVDALLYKGRIHVRRLAKDKAATAAQWREARSWFLKANKIDPDLALAYVLFYNSFRTARERPTANAVTGLLLAEAMVPQDNALRWQVAQAMIEKGDLTAARASLRPIAYSPHAGAENPARALLAVLDANPTPEAVRSAVEDLRKKAEANTAN